jgi:two-component system phosphate regulon response regulator PhoB
MENKKILIVDDDLTSQNMLVTTLSSEGYAVLTASSGHEGIELAGRELPGLIILDIMMPGMDGIDVAAILRDAPKTKAIPIIFLSVLIAEKQERTDYKKGAMSFLSKPYNREKLLNEVRKYFNRELNGKKK